MTRAQDPASETPRPKHAETFEIFLVAAPGLEEILCEEAKATGFNSPAVVPGGVTVQGSWRDVWRANLELRGAGRVLARIGTFRAMHLAQLDKRARRIAWSDLLRADIPVRVEATCRASRIYHSGAAAQRVARAINEELGAQISDEADVTIRARLDDDLCTLAIDTSGAALYKRGHKEAVAKAPMRETMAALLLRRCGYRGTEPVLDPMCGSGTFVIEAAEIAAGLRPGRSRSFAFEQLATFDAEVWQRLRDTPPTVVPRPDLRFSGSDRDAGAVAMSAANAERAGVSHLTSFQQLDVTEIKPPDGPHGLVIVNPPYGMRIGDKAELHALHRALGHTLKSRFSGWRVGLVTSDEQLARATGLPFLASDAPVSHGGLRVTLFRTAPLP